jgi:hypothetical protein
MGAKEWASRIIPIYLFIYLFLSFRMQEASICLRKGDGLGTDGMPPMSGVLGGFV